MLVEPNHIIDLKQRTSVPEAASISEHQKGSAQDTPMAAHINCYNFKGLIAYLEVKYGRKGVYRVIGEFIDNPQYLIADKLDPSKLVTLKEEHLRDSAYWVSNELSHRLFANARKVIGGPDPLFTAGLGAAKRNFSRGVLFATRILGPGLLFKQAQKLNAKFNRTKELTLDKMGPDFAVIKVRYFPGISASKDTCDWNRGIYTGILKQAGFRKVVVSEERCRAEGADHCLFKISWKKENFLTAMIKSLLRRSLSWAVGELVEEYESSVKERDQLIERLTLSEKRYRSFFENSATPTIIVERDLRVSMANGEFERLSGYPRSKIQGILTLKDFLSEDSIALLLSEKKGSMEEDKPKAEFQFRDARGNIHEVLIKSGKIPGSSRLVLSFVDITSRKRMEKTLRKSEEKHRSIIQSIEEGYFETDLAGRFTFVNDSLCKILGRSRSELIGSSYKKFVTPETADSIYKTFNRVYRTGRPVKVAEYEFFKKDKTRLFIGLSASLIKNQEEKAVGFRGILRDVTEREIAKREKRRLEARLEQAKRMEAIGTLAGGVAHDLNNILSGVVSYPDLLLMQLPPDSPMRKPLKTIQETGEKAATIVQDLLTLARRGVAVTEVMNVNKIISDYLASPEFEKLKTYHPAVELVTRLDKELLNIKGSPIHISKTIMNLVSNGAEAMPDGGVLTISTENLYLEEPLSGVELREGEYVVVKVSDTGIGMTDEEKERIFEPFYTKKVMGRSGTGLGMAVVWGTVQDHKGYIHVESTKGKGTTFTLYFPATREEIAEQERHLSIEEYMGKGETILVVDDIKEQREIATAILRRLNYQVYAVCSGEEAVNYMKEHTADVLLLDMIMDPGIDGLETYKRIIKMHPNQKAIIVSGFSESDRVKKAQELGAGTYVKKPYSMEKLGVTLRRTLESSIA